MSKDEQLPHIYAVYGKERTATAIRCRFSKDSSSIVVINWKFVIYVTDFIMVAISDFDKTKISSCIPIHFNLSLGKIKSNYIHIKTQFITIYLPLSKTFAVSIAEFEALTKHTSLCVDYIMLHNKLLTRRHKTIVLHPITYTSNIMLCKLFRLPQPHTNMSLRHINIMRARSHALHTNAARITSTLINIHHVSCLLFIAAVVYCSPPGQMCACVGSNAIFGRTRPSRL